MKGTLGFYASTNGYMVLPAEVGPPVPSSVGLVSAKTFRGIQFSQKLERRGRLNFVSYSHGKDSNGTKIRGLQPLRQL